jgi:hypothetical protein
MSVIKANIEMNEESVFDRAGCKRRYDAFWGRLDENRRVTVRIAMLIFEFVKNFYDEQKLMSKAADSDVQSAMYRKSLEWAKCAAAQADRFMLIAGVATRTAAFEKLDAIIAWANRNEWPITPLKWQLNPRKTAAELFVEIREAAKMRDRLLITERSTKKEAR